MKTAFLALSLLFAAPAFAQSSTEFFHQPAGGASEVTPHIGYRAATTRGSSANSPDIKWSGLDHLGVQYEYGLNPLLSLGADLSYTALKVTGSGTDGDANGLEPLLLKLKGQLPMEMGTLQYGLEASIGLEKAKSTSTTINRSLGDVLGDYPAGGFKVAPYLGYTFGLGTAGSIGAKLSYEVLASDVDVDSSGTTGTLKGGNAGHLSAFYETKLADVTLGGALLYDFYSKIQANTGGSDFDVLKSRNLFGLKIYSAIPMGAGMDILPSLTWREKASSDEFDKLSDVAFTVAGRFTF